MPFLEFFSLTRPCIYLYIFSHMYFYYFLDENAHNLIIKILILKI